MTLISEIFTVANQIDNGRVPLQILAHIMEEVGELSQEVIIAEGLSYKQTGSDGIVGEAVDAIICLVDIIARTNPTITEADLIDIASKKLQKWINTTIM